MTNPFVLILGPSGVGKSTVIRKLCADNPGTYSYVRPYTTRPLRNGEVDKIHLAPDDFHSRMSANQILSPAHIHGNWYGPSKEEIYRIISEDKIPVIDWPVDKVQNVRSELQDLHVVTIYMRPPSLEELARRLSLDSRDENKSRYLAAMQEFQMLDCGTYDEEINATVVSNNIDETAREIHETVSEMLATA